MQLIGEDTHERAQLTQVQLIRSFLKGGRLRGIVIGKNGIENLTLEKI